MKLSERILAASTDTEARKVLWELWLEMNPRSDASVSGWYKFYRMVNASAYLSAAEAMLSDKPVAITRNVMWTVTMHDMTQAESPTAWQALAAAIAKTKEG